MLAYRPSTRREDGLDQELKAYLDERFGRVDERFKQVEAETRHTRVLVEGMNDHIRLLAEAVVGTNERIDTAWEETRRRFDVIEANVKMIPDALVPRVANLENRLGRENRDIIEVIRERFGIGQT